MPRSPKELLGALAGFLLLIVLSPIILLALLLAPFTYYWEYRRANSLRLEFETRWELEGKQGILVYSDSPHWKAYIEEKWLPLLGDRFIVLNWSHKTRWPAEHPLEARIFRTFAGVRDFNPLAIIFPRPRTSFRTVLADALRRGDLLALLFPTPDVKVIRFWKPFRDFKHGRERSLRAAERELFAALKVPSLPDADAAA